ncbi:hypothetical protein S40288_10598 [Stachybotrys chartarum IBT 40288]|nr:hypothetical protein S40288_10598 [Stachybotrys chartarum IBT 40288]
MGGGGNLLLLRNNAADVHMDAWGTGTGTLHNRYDISEDCIPSCLLGLDREAGQVHRATMGFGAGRGRELGDWVMTSPSC